MYPEDLKYAKTHEWARVEGDTATVGITFHAQNEIQDVVYVELPEVGRMLSQGEEFGVIESVKAAFDLYVPLSGEVIAVNEALEEHPELVNESPYDEGWMFRIRLTQPSEIETLMDAAAYQAMLESEEDA